MLAKTHSASLLGIEALPVQVEVNTGLEGDPRVCIVGLPDASVRESQDRVHSALINSGHQTPHTRATVNLAPGDLRKEGPSFDLPIALGKPVLVMRNTTERPEAVEAGTVRLVGNDTNLIMEGLRDLLNNRESYLAMTRAHNPYGDGKACDRIVKACLEWHSGGAAIRT